MMYLEISSKLRRVRVDERELFLCGETFTRDSDGPKTMLDAHELPECRGEAAPEITPAPEVAIKPSGT